MRDKLSENSTESQTGLSKSLKMFLKYSRECGEALLHPLQPALKKVQIWSVACLKGTLPDNLDAVLLVILNGVP